MTLPSLAFGSDHAGFLLKQILIETLDSQKWKSLDCGTLSETSVDYPDFILPVVHHIYKGGIGVLICGTGIGMSIGANRFSGIRAALCLTPEMAHYARTHNNANILVLGSHLISPQKAKLCLEVFCSTAFEGEERHLRRILKLDIPTAFQKSE